MKVAAIQMRSKKAYVEENRARAVKYVKEAAANGATLISLPELWVTGYGIDTDMAMRLSERTNGPTVTMFQQLAKELNVVLIVPFPEREVDDEQTDFTNTPIYISAAVIDADGSLCGVYRKSMLWGEEKGPFQPGVKEYDVFQTSAGTVGVLICYDIEFPEPARLLALQGANLLIVPSVWSIKAEHRWDIQLPARALDNSVYVLGVNTIGEGACGKSKFVNPEGVVVDEASPHEEEIVYGVVELEMLQSVREEIPYLLDYPIEFTPGGNTKGSGKIKGA